MEERRCAGVGGSCSMRLVWTSSPSPCLLCSPSPPTPSRRSSTPHSLVILVRLNLLPLEYPFLSSIWYPNCSMCHCSSSPHPLLPSSRQWMPIITAPWKRDEISSPQEKAGEQRKFLPAVSTSLALAAGIGLMETVALILGSGTLMDIVGVPVDSPMRIPAEQFLTLRAYGAPPVIVALAAQGAFRGFMDTKTPLFAVVAGNLVNALLDAIFIFPLGLGVSGAALATVTSECLTAFILLCKLNSKIVLFSWNIVSEDIIRYLKSGALLIARTIAVVLTFTVSTSLAAREGSVPMAGYEICLQVWLTISLLNDALALAGQALLASEYAKGNYKKARIVLYRVLQIGGVTGVALATTLFLGFGYLSLLFTDDPAVLDVAQTGVWFVTISQPINAVAFVVDGLYYGVSDFAFAAYSTLFAGPVSSAVLLAVAPKFGLGGVWAGLTLFMSLRAIAGFWRLGSKGGPWKIIWSETEQTK